MRKVSIVIPTHDRPQLLRRAVTSVLAQTFQDFELIVVQNGEKENAKSFVRELAEQGHPIRYVHERKSGGANARNVGIKEATGQYIAFLDDDDEWLSNKLEKQVEILDQNPETGLVTCRGWAVDRRGSIRQEVPANFSGNPTLFDLIIQGNVIYSLSTILVRKVCFEQLGMFEAKYSIANDYEFYLRLARAWKIVSLEEPLYRYQLHEGNLSFGNRYGMWKETLEILSSQKSLVSEKVNQKEIRAGIRLYAKNLHAMALEAMDKKQYTQASRYYFEAVRYEPAIGIESPWSRFSNSFYRVLKPYLSMVLCALLSLGAKE